MSGLHIYTVSLRSEETKKLVEDAKAKKVLPRKRIAQIIRAHFEVGEG
jgi:hypothetical protein